MKNSLQKIRDKAVPILNQAGVVRSSLFGSVARGEETLESDIDILVEFPRGKSLFDLVALKMALEEALEAKADGIKRDEMQISELLKE